MFAFVCICVCICFSHIYAHKDVHMCACMFAFVCMHICMYAFVYILVYILAHTYVARVPEYSCVQFWLIVKLNLLHTYTHLHTHVRLHPYAYMCEQENSERSCAVLARCKAEPAYITCAYTGLYIRARAGKFRAEVCGFGSL
jgi:hypothetical protein